jgi:queuosine precursor transporter
MKKNAVAGAMVALYLGAIVLANLSSAHFGPEASIYNAFLFIGLILSTRDYLNELWGERRRRNMLLLIVSGSAISYAATKLIAVGPSELVAKIALASCVAFLVAETVDWLRFETLKNPLWRERAWISNAFSAPVDSMIFVSIAFGWSWEIIVAQTCAKFFGGFIWAYGIDAFRSRRLVVA